MKRGSIGSGPATTTPASISSELHAVVSQAIAMSMQPHIPVNDTRLRWLMAEGCRRRRNASQREPTAYEAR